MVSALVPFTIDFLGDGTPLMWSLTGTDDEPDWTATRDEDYRPALYVVSATGVRSRTPDPEQCVNDLLSLREDLEKHPAVSAIYPEWWRPGFRFAEQPVLRIEVDRMGSVRDMGRFVERRGPPGQVPYRAFDVDFSPEFRYCLDRGYPRYQPALRQSSISGSRAGRLPRGTCVRLRSLRRWSLR